jgi:transposase
MTTWVEREDMIAVSRARMTCRAARWVTVQVGRFARPVSDIATELGCHWHTVNATVMTWGAALLAADRDRIGDTDAIGLDETLHERRGKYKTKAWATSVVDVRGAKLLDLVEGRTADQVIAWFKTQPDAWVARIRYGTLDMSGPYRKVFNTVFDRIDLIADPFHVVQLANQALDEVRRRVQNDTLGHRGQKDDPLYGARKLLVKADNRLTVDGRTKLLGLLAAGDPHGEVKEAWHAKETTRSAYQIDSHPLAVEFVTRLASDLQDTSLPPEINRLGRTLKSWATEITNWHKARVTNGPTEGVNNLIKRVKRAAFGIHHFKHYRIRALLYAGRPNWHLLNTITPTPH